MAKRHAKIAHTAFPAGLRAHLHNKKNVSTKMEIGFTGTYSGNGTALPPAPAKANYGCDSMIEVKSSKWTRTEKMNTKTWAPPSIPAPNRYWIVIRYRLYPRRVLRTHIILSEPSCFIFANVKVGCEPDKHRSIDVAIGPSSKISDIVWSFQSTWEHQQLKFEIAYKPKQQC